MKTEINEIEVNDVKYVKKGTEQINYEGDIKIVILQRGWVYIGRFQRENNDCKLFNAFNIRKWGTTRGLCELVDGATPDTKLDPCKGGLVEFDYLTVIHTITVNKEKWNQIG